MRKVAAMSLCVLLCSQIVACGASKETWIEDGAAMLGSDITSGEFVIDGEMYSFPCEVSDLIDKGWHISNNYDNKDTFLLDPYFSSDTFEMFNEDSSNYVTISAINMTNESAKLEDCSVESLKVVLSDEKDALKVVLPSGVTCKTKPEELNGFYGEADITSQDGMDYFYNFTADNDLICVANVSAYNDKVHYVKYSLSDDNWASVNNAEECAAFVDNALKTSFYGDYEEYVAGKFDTEEAAIELYESEIAYYAESIMYSLGIDIEYVSDDIYQSFLDLSKTILGKAKWDSPAVEMYNDVSPLGTLTLTAYPLNFFKIVSDDVTAINETFAEQYVQAGGENISDEDWTTLQNEYAGKVLETITPKANDVSYLEAVELTYDINLDDTILDDNDWNEIDDVIMGFVE